MMTKRLTHGRYKDGNERNVRYNAPTEIDYLIHIYPSGKSELPIPLDEMKEKLSDRPDLQQLLDERVESLGSFFSLEFDASSLHVVTLSRQSTRHGQKYLDEIHPCYAHLTLREALASMSRGMRAPNGKPFTNYLPLFLTFQHAECIQRWLIWSFTQLAEISCSNFSSTWHDLYVPDIIANLMTHAIVDFAKGNVSEPGIQFVLDCLRMGIYCTETRNYNGINPTGLSFPQMVPLMKKFLLNLIYHPQKRTREIVPDLGDLFQWLSILGLVDGDTSSWKNDLIHAILVEMVRRQARWVGKRMVEEFELHPEGVRCGFEQVPHRYKKGQMFSKPIYRRESQTEMVARFAKSLSRKELLGFWWKHGGEISGRVLLYSHAFYKVLAEGQSLESFKNKYDPVLGAAHPGDIENIRLSRERIEEVSVMMGVFEAVGYPCNDGALYKLCVWAMESRDGYAKVDPLKGGWKSCGVAGSLTRSGRSKAREERSAKTMKPPAATLNPYAILDTDSAWRRGTTPESRQGRESPRERAAGTPAAGSNPARNPPPATRNGRRSVVVEITERTVL